MKVELVTNLKRHATKILTDFHSSKEPVLITEYGRPSAYLLDVDDFAAMQNRMDILEEIARGETAVEQGCILNPSEAKDKLAKWLK